MSIHYDLMSRIKTRIEQLNLLDRDGAPIPEDRIVVLKTEANDKQRIILEDSNEESFPGVIIFHEEQSERWDKEGSTTLFNLMYYPTFISVIDLDRGKDGILGRPDEQDAHDLRLTWRDLINQHFCSQLQDQDLSPSICLTNKIQTKMFDFRDWNDDGLWRSTLAFEFGIYLPRDVEDRTLLMDDEDNTVLVVGSGPDFIDMG